MVIVFVYNHSTNSILFFLSGKTIRFSAYEFGIITGLRFGNISRGTQKIVTTLRDRYFGGKNIMVTEMEQILNGLRFKNIPDEHAVKLALYYVLERFVLPKSRKRAISLTWLTLLDNLEEFNSYPWGREAYDLLVNETKKLLVGRHIRYKKRQRANPKHPGGLAQGHAGNRRLLLG